MKYLAHLLGILAIAFLTACGTQETLPQPPDSDQVMGSSIWKTQAVLDLGMDLRCDGEFDFKADCTGPGVNERLVSLRDLPPEKLSELQNSARALRWDGQ